MKKIICVLLALSMFLVMVSCTSGGQGSNRPAARNAVMPSALTADQQEIIDFISSPGSHEIMLFDFNSEESFNSVELWVETYNNGVIVNHGPGLSIHGDTADTIDGRLAVIIDRAGPSSTRWTLTIQLGSGGFSSSVGTTEIPDEEGQSRAYGAITEPVTIEDGKEIILYSSLVSNRGYMSFFDNQTLLERPELLNDYLYAQLVRVKFSN